MNTLFAPKNCFVNKQGIVLHHLLYTAGKRAIPFPILEIKNSAFLFGMTGQNIAKLFNFCLLFAENPGVSGLNACLLI